MRVTKVAYHEQVQLQYQIIHVVDGMGIGFSMFIERCCRVESFVEWVPGMSVERVSVPLFTAEWVSIRLWKSNTLMIIHAAETG